MGIERLSDTIRKRKMAFCDHLAEINLAKEEVWNRDTFRNRAKGKEKFRQAGQKKIGKEMKKHWKDKEGRRTRS